MLHHPMDMLLFAPFLIVSFLAPFVATRLAMQNAHRQSGNAWQQGARCLMATLGFALAFAFYLELQRQNYVMQPGVNVALMLYRDALILPALWVCGAATAWWSEGRTQPVT